LPFSISCAPFEEIISDTGRGYKFAGTINLLPGGHRGERVAAVQAVPEMAGRLLGAHLPGTFHREQEMAPCSCQPPVSSKLRMHSRRRCVTASRCADEVAISCIAITESFFLGKSRSSPFQHVTEARLLSTAVLD